jgi:hypothetical protein
MKKIVTLISALMMSVTLCAEQTMDFMVDRMLTEEYQTIHADMIDRAPESMRDSLMSFDDFKRLVVRSQFFDPKYGVQYGVFQPYEWQWHNGFLIEEKHNVFMPVCEILKHLRARNGIWLPIERNDAITQYEYEHIDLYEGDPAWYLERIKKGLFEHFRLYSSESMRQPLYRGGVNQYPKKYHYMPACEAQEYIDRNYAVIAEGSLD